jgi:NAD(P)-dependent dehydrogenase (short-subunit alcohol dehydrogenase family)
MVSAGNRRCTRTGDGMDRIWFVTGSSKGFGRAFVEGALERGDKVAATARDVTTLDDIVENYGESVLAITLDVTDREQCFAAVREAHERFGRLDVVVNNAGYGLFGAVEEVTEQQLRDQLETNFFGTFHVTQAVLPIMREQGSGHIIQISTIGGVVAFPLLGGYHASKWALEGLTETLAQEIRPFGIKVTLVEPGGFDTDWNNVSATFADAQPQYSYIRDEREARRASFVLPKPIGVGSAMEKIIEADPAPLRVFFGEAATGLVPPVYQARLAEWDTWAPVSREAEGK